MITTGFCLPAGKPRQLLFPPIHIFKKNPSLNQSSASGTKRITSIDLLRGIVMIIMALDHTRDYFHADNFLYNPTDMSETNPPVFFTRWITHFCAPVFVFLAGTSAFLAGQRKSKKEMAAFLVKRGIWLMILELTIVNFGWSFNPAFPFTKLQVIWVLGFSMVLMSAMIFLPLKYILTIGLVLLFGHNLMDNIHASGNTFRDFLWAELHERQRFYFNGHTIATSYPVLPWFCIMALGYCFGALYQQGMNAIARKKYLVAIGTASILLFIILRSINSYGDMAPWTEQKNFIMTVCSFLNVTKYPPSLLYSLMTLGPVIFLLGFLEKPVTRFGTMILHIGRVPLFYYILHLYLIHILAIGAVVISGRHWTDMVLTGNITKSDSPWLQGFGLSLTGVYLVWIIVVTLLYPLCRWYDNYKTAHKEKWWLSYL